MARSGGAGGILGIPGAGRVARHKELTDMSEVVKQAIRDAVLEMCGDLGTEEMLEQGIMERHILPAVEREVAAAEARAYLWCAERAESAIAYQAAAHMRKMAEAAERRAKGTGGTT